MINFDLLVAGCNTRCRHCYVNGGPGPLMDGTDALRCIEQLDAIASHLSDEAFFTLDHEPINHPQIERIITAAAETMGLKVRPPESPPGSAAYLLKEFAQTYPTLGLIFTFCKMSTSHSGD